MKLSEAMVLGSMLRPQAFGPFYSNDHGGSTCAMGAALEAVGRIVTRKEKRVLHVTHTNMRRVKKIWPWLVWRIHMDRCPWCQGWGYFSNLYDVICHLNDKDHLSRYQIAELIGKMEVRVTSQLEPNPSEEARMKLTDLEAHLSRGKERKKAYGKKSESSCVTCGSNR